MLDRPTFTSEEAFVLGASVLSAGSNVHRVHEIVRERRLSRQPWPTKTDNKNAMSDPEFLPFGQKQPRPQASAVPSPDASGQGVVAGRRRGEECEKDFGSALERIRRLESGGFALADKGACRSTPRGCDRPLRGREHELRVSIGRGPAASFWRPSPLSTGRPSPPTPGGFTRRVFS
jgi:hypothetical protein